MEYVFVGKLMGTHALKGELKLKSTFSYLDKVLKEGFTFYIGDEKKKVDFLRYRYHNGIYLITFAGYEDINLVEDFKSKNIYVNKSDLSLNENEYVFEDYIGLVAYFDNNSIGTISNIIDCGNGNYVFLIKGVKEVLIPINDIFIDKVILGDRIIFKDEEGLLDAN